MCNIVRSDVSRLVAEVVEALCEGLTLLNRRWGQESNKVPRNVVIKRQMVGNLSSSDGCNIALSGIPIDTEWEVFMALQVGHPLV